MDELVLSGVRFPLSVGAFSEPLNCPLETRSKRRSIWISRGRRRLLGWSLTLPGISMGRQSGDGSTTFGSVF